MRQAAASSHCISASFTRIGLSPSQFLIASGHGSGANRLRHLKGAGPVKHKSKNIQGRPFLRAALNFLADTPFQRCAVPFGLRIATRSAAYAGFTNKLLKGEFDNDTF
jgi:hypothetical protein